MLKKHGKKEIKNAVDQNREVFRDKKLKLEIKNRVL